MKIEKIPVSRIRPAAYNPRVDLKPGDPEYEHIRNSISEFGYIDPVIWNRRTGNLVGGHQRFKVLLEQGMTEVDAVVVDMDDDQEKAANLALNKAVGMWDEEKMKSLLDELKFSFDMTDFGFDLKDLLPQGDIYPDHVNGSLARDFVAPPCRSLMHRPDTGPNARDTGRNCSMMMARPVRM